MFYKGLKAAKADESKMNMICGKLQISSLIGRGLAARFTPEGEGFDDQVWTINHDIVGAICTDYEKKKLTTEWIVHVLSQSPGVHLAADFSQY